MARVPISFYLNILAGILVLFNHFAASETGDVALNKITGAAGRFYTVFRDTALTIQHGCASHLETALCGSVVESVFPRDTVAYLKVHYCHLYPHDSESAGGTSEWQPHGEYGGSDYAFVHHQLPIWPLVLRTSEEDSLPRSSFNVDSSIQSHLSRTTWNRTSEAMAIISALLLRTHASWWWFRAPLNVTGFLLTAYATSSALACLFGASVVMQRALQLNVVVMADFLQCIQWEAQRQVLDISVIMMERACGFFPLVRQRALEE